MSKPTVAEPCVSKGGDRVSRDQVTQAIKALDVHDTINSPSFTDGYCPSTLSFEEPSKKKLQLAKDKLPDNLKDEADKLERHTITNETTYPWCTIGKVYAGKDANFNNPLWMGSGALVGRNLLLTAGHVAPWGLNRPWMKFIPAFENGTEPYGAAYVLNWYGYRKDGDVYGKDYVICKLNRSIGDQCGWLGYQWWSGQDNNYTSRTWTSVGSPAEPANPGGNYMLVEDNVGIVDVDDEGADGKELESNVFSLGDWSGGPLWGYIDGQGRVIGVLSGQETDFQQPRHTVSAGGKAMGDLVVYGQNNFKP
ncbi:uncharacterized protein ALTATR162_LOCUS4300 [Alternaria atra]|uniref:Serine protease n=1 Tax=Alternaria atra TaxID=119953 RepID=A0A8J2MYY3_9PLEO|nr:uncharacterized protein ALTATR162_LOCUS4300 [Alternaria atra]CAG5156503.1 unnamed protein product [Alternaria atra]